MLAILLFSHCKVVKYTPAALPQHQLIIGSGGGFAGIETTFMLLENGQIFKRTGVDGVYEELRPVKPKEAKAIFEKAATLQLYKMDIVRPGNLYYFIHEVTETFDSRVTWGAGDYLPPKNLIAVYKEVHDLVTGREVVKTGKDADKPTDEPDAGDDKPADKLKW